MNTTLLLLVAVAGVFLLIIWVLSRRVSLLNRDFFKAQWASIDNMSKTKSSWVEAIIQADKLLDEALKQMHYKGKSTADRMVAANRAFSNPDSVWKAHKIRNLVVHETAFKLRKAHVNTALVGFKRALKDLGAI